MKQALRALLSELPRLGEGASLECGECKICGGSSSFFDLVDFNKSCSLALYPFGPAGIPIAYLKCDACGFVFTNFFDDWTPQDFSEFIYNDDYVKVDGEYTGARPTRIAAALKRWLADHRQTRILDYGSGAGILVDQMRAGGFPEVYGYDPYSSPARPEGQFDIVLCHEVLEHTLDPVSAISDMRSFLAPGGFIIAETALQPPNISELRANWWYMAPRNGHVSIFTAEAIVAAARECGLTARFGGMIVLADNPLAPKWREFLDPISQPRYYLRLGAPALGNHPGWNVVEGQGKDRFRWTADGVVRWNCNAEFPTPCSIGVAIPVKSAILPEFLSQSQISIGGRAVPAVYSNGQLTALLDITEPLPITEINLETPAPRRPCDLRDTSDARPLGVAVCVV